MNKHILSLLLLVPFCIQDAQAFIVGFWYPDAKLAPTLDLYYNSPSMGCKKIHQQLQAFYLALCKQQIAAAADLNDQEKETIALQTEQFAAHYTKHLAVYLSCACQFTETDTNIVNYLDSIDTVVYFTAFRDQYFPNIKKIEMVEYIEQFMPGELFAVWLVFLSDKHFQQEVEKYTKHTMEHYLK